MRRSPLIPRGQRVLRGAAGLTLIEVLVVVSLLALVVGAFVPLLSAGQQTWDEDRRRQEMVQNARIAFDGMLRTLRSAQSFLVISSTNLRFTYFFGDNASTPTVEYQLNTTTNELEFRRDPDPFQPFAGPFRSMSVTCFDASNASIACTSVASVRAVQVALVAMDPDGQIPDITVTSRAFRHTP